MEIGLYIAELLGEQDEVSVPGLGTFMKIRVAGSFDESQNVFNPPSYQLDFKEANTSYSGLSEYISNHKNLSIASAEELIKKFITGIKNSLNNSDPVAIKHLGSLYKQNGILTFKAIETFSFAGSFYGLKPVAELKRVSTAPPIQEEKPKEDKDDIEAPDYTRQVESEGEDEVEVPKARLIPILVISFLAVIATLAALFYFDTSFNHKIRNIFVSKKTSTQAIAQLNDSLNTNEPDTLIANTTDNTFNAKDSLVEKVKPGTEQISTIHESITYEIIVASFYKESEAEEYIRNLETKGMKAKIVANIPGKMHKISMGTFKDEESATKELSRIQKEINKDAWIARVKPLNNPQ